MSRTRFSHRGTSRTRVAPWIRRVALCVVGWSLMGCATDGLQRWNVVSRLRGARPDRLVVTASSSPLEDSNGQRHQGMLCRLYFFDGDDPQPVRVKGDLDLTAVDSKKRSDVPKAKYAVPADKLASHLRKDLVGDSYLFWLPSPDQEPGRVLVRACFRPAGKRVKPQDALYSKTVTVDLEGEMAIAESREKVGSDLQVQWSKGGRRRPNVTIIDSGVQTAAHPGFGESANVLPVRSLQESPAGKQAENTAVALRPIRAGR